MLSCSRSGQFKIGLALSCVDHRLLDSTIDLLKNICMVDAFDHVILAGASFGYNQTVCPHWKLTFLDHIDLALKLHNITHIVIIDHEDCNEYKLNYPLLHISPQYERLYHIIQVKQCIEDLKELYPSFDYSGYLLSLSGYAEKIY
jgi:hypothetical protein